MKELIFIGSSRDDLREFPDEVKSDVGYALFLVQQDEMPSSAKPLKGFKGASVLEIKEDFNKNTYRAVYTVKMKNYVFVLHCFQKKSNKGIKTNKIDIDLIKERLKVAEEYLESE